MITVQAVMSLIVFSSIAISLICFLMYQKAFVLKVGLNIIIFLIGVLLIRMFFPFELPFLKMIKVTKVWPDIHVFLITPLFWMAGKGWSPLCVMVLCFISGTIFLLIGSIISYGVLMYSISSYNLIEDVPIKKAMERVCLEHNRKKQFKLVKNIRNFPPFIFGLRNTYIVLPAIQLSEMDWYYVLNHEVRHYYNNDMWTRILCELLCALYWWNPFVHLLRRKLIELQEWRIDFSIINGLPEVSKNDYLECLVRISKMQMEYDENNVIPSFCKKSKYEISNRINVSLQIIDGEKEKKYASLINFIVGVLTFVMIIILPNTYIFEPSKIKEEHIDNSFLLDEVDIYLMEQEDGSYDVYINAEYSATVTTVFDERLKVIRYDEGR